MSSSSSSTSELPAGAKNPQASENRYQAQPHAESPHGIEPSGPKGDNPATAGPGPSKVQSATPENSGTEEKGEGHINPSAPEDANITPGTIDKK